MVAVVAIRIDSRTTSVPMVLVVAAVVAVETVHSIIAVNITIASMTTATTTTTDVTTMVVVISTAVVEEEVVSDQTTKGLNNSNPSTEEEDEVEAVDDDNIHASLWMKISKWVNPSICKFLVVFNIIITLYTHTLCACVCA